MATRDQARERHARKTDDTKDRDHLEDTESEGDEEDEVDDVAEHDQAPRLTYRVAKSPGFPNTPVSKTMRDFSATDFIPILSAFLRRKFPKYRTPRIYQSTIQDTIRATTLVPRNGRTAEKPAHFDTALIHYNQEAQETGALGYRVARVLAIVRLPLEIDYPHPVAYVEWYSAFRTQVAGPEMYVVSLEKGPGRVAIVSLS
ncbi:hypothetical protein JB92DRAFT_3102107 [Gautieria morchelliformis]|nr:hypothetical protein JB92DRAFT_3102107 [Gautieria morchelliformis]